MGTETRDGRDGRVDVAGSTTLEAVDAETFETTGSTTVTGDVRADDVDAAGSVGVGGDLVAEAADLSGSTDVDGDLVGGRVDASGTLDVAGDVRGGTLDASGSLDVGGDVLLEGFDARGSITVGDLRAETVDVAGALAVDAVVAETVDLRVARLAVDRIEADRVEVTPESRGLLDEIRRRLPGLDRLPGVTSGVWHRRIEEITAGRVDLTGASVATLVAEEATLGPDTDVDVLRARTASVHEDAGVGERRPHPDERA